MNLEKLKKKLKELEKSNNLKIEEEYLRDDKPIQLVVRTKPYRTIYFRAKPYTAYKPTLPQLKARIRFGELAKKAKGLKFKQGDKYIRKLPPAAEIVKKEMSGEKFGRTERVKKWEIIFAELIKLKRRERYGKT